ncbi:MFS transporter [Micromonospora endolithica]|uniref:MFS transporter n=1 Tax=Micromonospora endolithica TaxID=230091 RepID=A0A3A9ZB09_9ACTN|nr:MFS transporter [Micromonospora endolithica]RKN45405.1 MFS transporter [Micromonospora endolithica]TWJ22883.1 putative MFS family arabinose efflux permease [Micromonospora endolithica]
MGVRAGRDPPARRRPSTHGGGAVTGTHTAARAARPGRAARVRDLMPSLVLAAIAFTFVTGETLPVGLLGDIAAGLDTSPGVVGLSVSVYAATAALTAVPLTRLLARWPRRRILVATAAAFTAGHLLVAAAPSVWFLMAGRAVSAVAHGLYFAVAMPVVTRLAAPEHRGRVGGRIIVGGATALVVGTPLVTLLGQAAGWRFAALAVAGVALALAGMLTRTLPSLPVSDDAAAAGGRLLPTLRFPGLPVVLAVTLLVVGGHFVFFTYLAPYAAQSLDVRGPAFSAVLLGFGLASVAGSALGGRLADARPVAGVRAATALFVVVPVALWASGRVDARPLGAALLAVSGMAFSLLVVLTVLAALRRVDDAHAETANAVHGITFQAGILGGSALGSLCYRIGQVEQIPLLTATFGAVAFLLVLTTRRAFGPRHAAPGGDPHVKEPSGPG